MCGARAARSIAFYRDVLGMTPTQVDDEGRGAEFTLGDGLTFGVWNPEGMEDAPGTSGGMFAVGDARAAVARIRERGGNVSDPMETPVCFMAFGKDPKETASSSTSARRAQPMSP
jgi:predicted enzyme related to lactoylglutathione lyase